MLLTIVATCAGCTRAWWREQADCQVEETIAEKAGYLDRPNLLVEADSRLADPYMPDAEPIPPDDPESHQLMHEVDGHRGWKHWHDNGDAASVDLGDWLESLPRDKNGDVVVNLADAVKIGRKNSREYQTELEDLYLSALDVTFERFRFNTQFFLGNSTDQTFDGPQRNGPHSKSTLDTTTTAQMQRLTGTGGELVVGLANSLVWQFSGKGSDSFSSVLNFSLVQPLLQFGGRARVLEQLTQRERTLLANVRQMEQFRRGFYVQIVAGRNSGDGPLRQGLVGQGGLGILAGLPSGRSGAAPVGGFLGVLQEAQQIRNRDANLVALRDSVAQLDAYFQSGRLPIRLQVDQTRQAYYNAQSNQLSSRAGYASRLDAFKMALGLPPSLPLQVQDALIDRFNLIEPALTNLLNEVNDVLDVLRAKSKAVGTIGLSERYAELLRFEDRMQFYLDRTSQELAVVEAALPQREIELRQLQRRIDQNDHSVDVELFDPALLRGRVAEHKQRYKENRTAIATSFAGIKAVKADQIKDQPEEAREQLEDHTTKLSGVILDSMLTQAAIRLESIGLIPVEVGESQALEIARINRLDWMNARANLVDSWRKIEFTGNALQSNLNVLVSGDIGTRGDNPLDFSGDDGRLKLGFQFDSAITRLSERNRYRESLIEFQRARRAYMLFEDQVSQSLRNTLRIVDLSQVNFEIRRAALFIAISQVTLARMRLNEPAKGVAVAPTVSPTTARDLVSALNDLLDAQNDLLNAWVSYEVLRMLLDFEMGTMSLSPEGMWVDPGPVPAASAPKELVVPLIPPPLAVDAANGDKPQQLEEGIKPMSGWRPTAKDSEKKPESKP